MVDGTRLVAPSVLGTPGLDHVGVYEFRDVVAAMAGGNVIARVDGDLVELAALVVSWMREVGYCESTCAVTAEGLDRFVGFAGAHGVDRLNRVTEELAAGFVAAPGVGGGAPVVATMHHRRSVLRVFFRVLHSLDTSLMDPTWALVLPSRSVDALRPLTDDEVDVLRAVSLATLAETRQPSIVALAEAGAVTTEIAAVTATDIDFATGLVSLPGCYQANARQVPLTEWGAAQLARRIEHFDGVDVSLTYAGANRRHAGQASISTNLRRLFTRARLTNEPDLGLASVRAWAGRRAFDASGRIEDAACLLGCRSLDAAARLIAWDWQDGP